MIILSFCRRHKLELDKLRTELEAEQQKAVSAIQGTRGCYRMQKYLQLIYVRASILLSVRLLLDVMQNKCGTLQRAIEGEAQRTRLALEDQARIRVCLLATTLCLLVFLT